MSYNSINLSLIILTILLLHACAKTHHSETLLSSTPAIKQSFQKKQKPKPKQDIYHTVLKGETLAEIANSYGYTEKELGASNGISPPYTIIPGETLVIPSGNPIKLHGYNYEAIPVIIPPPPKPEQLND